MHHNEVFLDVGEANAHVVHLIVKPIDFFLDPPKAVIDPPENGQHQIVGFFRHPPYSAAARVAP